MMIGTDIRLMTPIMKELLLNEESIAINQDYLAVPGDAMMGCSGPAPPPLPPTGLPEGWTQEQWNHFGWQYVESMMK